MSHGHAMHQSAKCNQPQLKCHKLRNHLLTCLACLCKRADRRRPSLIPASVGLKDGLWLLWDRAMGVVKGIAYNMHDST